MKYQSCLQLISEKVTTILASPHNLACSHVTNAREGSSIITAVSNIDFPVHVVRLTAVPTAKQFFFVPFHSSAY